MIKLLKKSEVDTAKAQDKQREINEGMKLASRVDSLRKTQAEEEASLEKFRKETVSKINREILSKTEELDILKHEVEILEDRKRVALEPLDEQWDEIRVKQDELTGYAIQLNSEKSELESKKSDLEVEIERISTEKRRVSRERDDSISNLAKSDENRSKTVSELSEAKRIKLSAVTMKESVVKELKERDAVVASKERDVSNKYLQLEKDRKALEKERVRLLDQRGTLERAMNRLKKK